jgi:hypothetical protein
MDPKPRQMLPPQRSARMANELVALAGDPRAKPDASARQSRYLEKNLDSIPLPIKRQQCCLVFMPTIYHL